MIEIMIGRFYVWYVTMMKDDSVDHVHIIGNDSKTKKISASLTWRNT